uniref:Aconitate hydratase, cytoplasmic, putative / citrate hydro-lyase/aconitase, putative n=1 Tax=Arundo donax TaxID=35708 RepID=A0A0A8XVS4_ARUDO
MKRLRWWRHIFELTRCLLITTRLKQKEFTRLI